MANRYRKHYTRDEARALLPQIRTWIEELARLRLELATQDDRITTLRGDGVDLGGGIINESVATLVELQAVLLEFYRRDIQVKDLDRGLVDFPAFVGGKEVFLCWEKCEEDIEYWHDIDAGYAGREPL